MSETVEVTEMLAIDDAEHYAHDAVVSVDKLTAVILRRKTMANMALVDDILAAVEKLVAAL